MKKIFIAAYILLVATLSISARAQDSSTAKLRITSSTIDTEVQAIKVLGYFPDPCVGRAELKAVLINANTVEISLVGPRTSGMCVQVIGAQQALVIDAANIKHAMLLASVNLNGRYHVISKQGKIDTEFNFDNILPRPFYTDSVTGEVIAMGAGFGIANDIQTVKLVSPFIDLENHLGQAVTLTGHLDSQDLVGTDIFKISKRSEPKFIVTGLRLVD